MLLFLEIILLNTHFFSVKNFLIIDIVINNYKNKFFFNNLYK
jgi:hypothetical protein